MESLGFSVLFAINQDMDGSIAHKRRLGRDISSMAQKGINSPNVLNNRQ